MKWPFVTQLFMYIYNIYITVDILIDLQVLI